MKTKILLSLILINLSIPGFATTWTITNSGFTFVPDTIIIVQGDTINFSMTSFIHIPTEVSKSTWLAAGTTQLPGGFATPGGGGLVLPAQLPVDTHYYVCANHASFGMKGIIIVQSSSGISVNQSAQYFSVFPNPATDQLTIKIGNNLRGQTYFISDQEGKLVLSGKLENESVTVDIARLEPGVYYVQVGQLRKKIYKIFKN